MSLCDGSCYTNILNDTARCWASLHWCPAQLRHACQESNVNSIGCIPSPGLLVNASTCVSTFNKCGKPGTVAQTTDVPANRSLAGPQPGGHLATQCNSLKQQLGNNLGLSSNCRPQHMQGVLGCKTWPHKKTPVKAWHIHCIKCRLHYCTVKLGQCINTTQ